MQTKWRYFIYVVVLHLLLGAAAYWLLREQLYFFLPLELVILISCYIAFRFYRAFTAPVRIIEQGEASLLDQDFTHKFIPVGSPEIDRLVDLYNAMIDNIRTERASKQEQHFFLQKLIAVADLGVIVLDFDGRISDINDWARELLDLPVSGWKETSLVAINHPLAAVLVDLRVNNPEVLQLAGNQRYRVEKGDFVDRGFSRHFIIIQDITSDLLAAEKEAYGKVIRMMAHEVNNSTGATNSLLQSLADANELAPVEYQQLSTEYLPTVIERGEKMNKFMRNFADVIRLPAPNLERIDLREVLAGVSTLFSAKARQHHIELQVDLDENPVIVWADPGQLEQVIINALTNARESIDEGGTIRLCTQYRPAGFIIEDNGPGIATEYIDRIFTPFFSTKPTGQGVGLTLMRDVLQAHGARYQLRTEEDGWTRLRVSFG
ncbi:MAG: ATP-binding protein [Bacteroidota bacterium]